MVAWRRRTGFPAAPPPEKADPLTDLMRRVNDLEGELKKDKEKQRAKAADAGKKPTVNWSMQVQADAIWSGQDAANREAVGVIPDVQSEASVTTPPVVNVQLVVGMALPATSATPVRVAV